MYWWRRWESNPRPKVTQHKLLRVQSLHFEFRRTDAQRQASGLASYLQFTFRSVTIRTGYPTKVTF